MLHTSRKRWLSGAAIVAIGALVLTACASQREEGGGDEEASDVDTTFVFGASGDVSSLDPAFASDGESFRVARQIFEGLVGVEAGTADPAPLLAESWEQSEDGLSYTFQLKEGVTFHDGTEFNADAVCFNFDRQNNFTGLAQSQSLSYYWGVIMRGYADSGTSIYGGCEATSPTEADDHADRAVRRVHPRAVAARRSRSRARRRSRSTRPTTSDGTAEAPTLQRVRHGPPDRHRAVPVRLVGAGRADDRHRVRGLLGRAGRRPGGHLPRASATPPRVARRSRPAASTATTSSRPPTSARSRTTASCSSTASRSTCCTSR